jgi:Fe-Mn family superoxide dismutase
MRLHELYFPQLESGFAALTPEGSLAQALTAQFGSPEEAVRQVRLTGSLRGPGWSILYYDPETSNFLIGFTGEQHQGHFAALPIILALDVWEHAFILDYGAQGKGKYVDAFFQNLNWSVIEKRFAEAA